MRISFNVSFFLLFFLVFFHVFNLKASLPPYNLILISAALGAGLLFIQKDRVDKKLFYVLLFIAIQFIVLLFSFLVNQKVDFFFFKEIILNQFISLLSASFIVKMFAKKTNDNFTKLSLFIFGVVSCQLVLSYLGYLNKSFYNIIFTIFNLGNQEIIADLSEQRMVGLGAAFFGSGVINSLILILIASFIITSRESSEKIKLLLMYFIIMLLGILSSRSTSVGIVLSLFIIFLNLNNLKLKTVLLLTLIAFIFLIFNIDLFDDTRFGKLLSFGLGFIVDFENSNAANSTYELVKMFSNVPDNLKTWLIGDSLYRDGYEYYKGTDIGYSRIIFATGILGLLSYCAFITYLIFNIHSERITFLSKLLILILFFILMVKGVVTFFPILMLLYLSSLNSKNIKVIT